jgi:hypothetical protein
MGMKKRKIAPVRIAGSFSLEKESDVVATGITKPGTAISRYTRWRMALA